MIDDYKIKNVVESLIDTFLEAGEVSIKLRNEGLNKKIKSDNTPVSNGDLEVNKIITKKLLELTPDIPIVSEETSHNKSKTDLKNFWLVDPIDGTSNFIHGIPHVGIIVAKMTNNEITDGVIYNPILNEFFWTSKGKGAWCNSSRLNDGGRAGRRSRERHHAIDLGVAVIPKRTRKYEKGRPTVPQRRASGCGR